MVRQAEPPKASKSSRVARFLIENSLETEFPGISFRDSSSGRAAYLTGHRVALWAVLDVHGETNSIQKTAEHFHWPTVMVKRALAYAKAFPEESRLSQDAERQFGLWSRASVSGEWPKQNRTYRHQEDV